MISLKIERKFLKDTHTVGNLYYKLDNGEWLWFCNTLEDKVRDYNKDGKLDEPKIYGQTAIPYGHYKFIIAYSPKLKTECPVLIDVPGFSGVMIHFGNSTEDTLGCPLVGQNKEVGKLVNSRWTFDKLMNLLTYNYQSEYDLIIV